MRTKKGIRSLVVPLTKRLVAVTLSLAAISFFIADGYSNRVVAEMIERISKDTNDRAWGQMELYFDSAERMTLRMHGLFAEGLVSQDDVLSVEKHLLHGIINDPLVDYVYMANPKGGVIIAGRDDKGLRISVSKNNEAGELRNYAVNSDGSRTGASDVAVQEFDPRVREWYQKAPRNGSFYWSDAYPWIQEEVLGITVSMAVIRDDEVVGVIGTDLKLDRLSDYLSTLEVSPNGLVYLVEGNGLLVGTSLGKASYYYDGNRQTRIYARASENPVIRETQRILENATVFSGEVSQDRNIKYHGRSGNMRVFISSYVRGGNDWYMVTVVPESDFTSEIDAFKRTYGFVSVGFICISVVIAYLFSKGIIRPINDLITAAEKLAVGQKDFRIHLDRQDEIGRLENTFNHMADQIVSLVDNLNNKNQELVELNRRLEHKVRERTKALEMMAMTDGMTGIRNHKYLMEKLENLMDMSNQTAGGLSVVLMDLDHFKGLNDNFGHLVGDIVLKEFAQIVANRIREGDTFGRYGGEEFLLIMPGTGIHEATAVAEGIRRMVAEYAFAGTHQVTVSMGVAEIHGDTLEGLLNRADEALYRSKASGRNRVSMNMDMIRT